MLGDTQSVSALHVVLHKPVVESHLNGGQAIFVGGTHLPLPSHADAGVDDKRSVAQCAALQFFPLSTSAHAPDLHSPVVPQVAGAVTAQMPCASGVPSATAVHVPVEADRLHVKQAPVQALLQQTP